MPTPTDPSAAVDAATERKEHEPGSIHTSLGPGSAKAWCFACDTFAPCKVLALLDALDAARGENARLKLENRELRDIVFAEGNKMIQHPRMVREDD